MNTSVLQNLVQVHVHTLYYCVVCNIARSWR